MSEIASIARHVLDSEANFAEAQAVIDDYVQRFISRRQREGAGDFGSVETGISELTGKAGVLEWMPSFSLEAFNPFSGLNESAAAIRDLSDRTSLLVDDLSTEVPWRMELLLYDVEQRETLREVRGNLERASDSAASLAQTAADWPADVEQVVKTTLDELDASQVGLRQTLQQTLDALVEARTLVEGLNQTAANLTDAGEAWDDTFQTLGLGGDEAAGAGSGSEPAEPGKEARPFDILEYRDTAEELRRVAVELRGLVNDVHALTGESGEDTPLLGNIEVATQTAAAAAAGEGRALADHIALRLIQLVGVIFFAAIVYRVAASRIAPRPTTGPG
ncbi:MAG: hypothetical protein GY719_40575 [bacterium]|nr:hypothetical protein [bacterium]